MRSSALLATLSTLAAVSGAAIPQNASESRDWMLELEPNPNFIRSNLYIRL